MTNYSSSIPVVPKVEIHLNPVVSSRFMELDFKTCPVPCSLVPNRFSLISLRAKMGEDGVGWKSGAELNGGKEKSSFIFLLSLSLQYENSFEVA